MSTLIIRLVQIYKWVSLDTDSNPEAKHPATWAVGSGRKAVEKVWVRSGITTYANDEVWVKMQEADSESELSESNPEVCTSMSTRVSTTLWHSIHGYAFDHSVSFEPFRPPSTFFLARSSLISILSPAIVVAYNIQW